MSVFSCRDTVQLASESLDRELAYRELVALRFHRLVCTPCARFYRQLFFLREAARRLDEQTVLTSAGLSPEVRARLKRALEQPD